MGTIGLSRTNRLFWLGRYLERVYTTLKATRGMFDAETDGAEADYKDYCRRMGIACHYENTAAFIRSYYFDAENADSVAASLAHAYDNAIVLRETLSSDTLSYVQMAVTAMELAAKSSGPAVELQWVLDDIMAFRGSCEENIEEEINRNIIKSGASLERVDIFLRLGYPQEQCLKEVRHLASRLKKAQLTVNENNMQFLLNSLAGSPENLPPAPALTAAAEGLLVNI